MNKRVGIFTEPWALSDKNSVKLVGMDTFWWIALEVRDEDVATFARQRLLMISRPVSERDVSSHEPCSLAFAVRAMEF